MFLMPFNSTTPRFLSYAIIVGITIPPYIALFTFLDIVSLSFLLSFFAFLGLLGRSLDPPAEWRLSWGRLVSHGGRWGAEYYYYISLWPGRFQNEPIVWSTRVVRGDQMVHYIGLGAHHLFFYLFSCFPFYSPSSISASIARVRGEDFALCPDSFFFALLPLFFPSYLFTWHCWVCT